jgi:nitrite reductase/ring-hydroxylating ferredoxin subunit
MMALFGVDGQKDAPIRAVNAALQTLAAIDRMKPFVASMYKLDFDIRIGLHHGEALLGSVGTLGHERLTAIGDVVNVASRVEGANKEAGTRLLISEALYRLVEDQVEMRNVVRTRLRGTSERITLYEIQRLKPEVEATLNARVRHESERYAGREWLRACAEDELAVGERRILELDKCDVVVHRGPNGYLAFNNACPHVRLPFYDRMPPKEEHAAKLPPRQSVVTDDLGIVCRWHGSCYDLQRVRSAPGARCSIGTVPSRAGNFSVTYRRTLRRSRSFRAASPMGSFGSRWIAVTEATSATHHGVDVSAQLSAEPIARSGPRASGSIGRIGEIASVDRKAAASDAFGQSCAETLELGDPLVDPLRPFA